MKRTVIIVSMILALAGSCFAAEPLKLSEPFDGAMGTASAVGGWYVIGGGICNVLSEKVEGLTLTPQVTGGSVENVRLLDSGENELIMVGSGSAISAIDGTAPFTKKYEDMVGLFTFGATATHIVVRKDSGISAIEDLKGKRVAIGPPGSGTERISQVVFPLAGVNADNTSLLPMAFADMYNALRDSNVDAFLLQASPPGPALEELARTIEISLVDTSTALVDELAKLDRSYYSQLIKAGTYSGVDVDVNSAYSVSYVACKPDLPDEVAYAIVKGLYENLADVHAIHAGAREITLESAILGIPTPLHPGAERYYKEVGLIK